MKYEIWRKNPDDDVMSMIHPYLKEDCAIIKSTGSFHVVDMSESDADAIATAMDEDELPAVTSFFPLEGPNFEPPIG